MTWDTLEKIGFGTLGITPAEFLDYTPRQFWNKLEGFYELEQVKDRRADIRTRWQTAFFVNCFTDKDHKIEPQDLIEFDWEAETKVIEVPTIEDFERIKKQRGIK